MNPVLERSLMRFPAGPVIRECRFHEPIRVEFSHYFLETSEDFSGMKTPEENVVEYAWLVKDEEYWCFYAENSGGNKRKWPDRENAIRELEKDGWNITTVYYQVDPDERKCAYGMVRFLH